jgi:hypothetical protein
MNKKVNDRIVATDGVEVKAKFDLETLLYELALENLAQVEKAQDRLERAKYSAATIVFVHATVEAYFNWILQHRMLTHNDKRRRLLGEMINRIRTPISDKWGYVIAGLAYLATEKWIETTEATKKKAQRLSILRNYVTHYKAELISTEKLRRTEEGVVVTEAEEMLTPDSAREAVGAARALILELHEREGSPPPTWIGRGPS